ncbi:hypothetical protein TNCV_5102461 [Trichonephila clavipes]|nr:hypothetical protein TNCV_5102461 [Trichonephila clavipes]
MNSSLVPLNTHRAERLMHVKSVESLDPSRPAMCQDPLQDDFLPLIENVIKDGLCFPNAEAVAWQQLAIGIEG